MSVSKPQVDAVLDTVADDESPARALVELLDANVPSWTIAVGTERGSVVESSGAWWAVRASDSGACDAVRCASRQEAETWIGRWF